MKRSQNTTSSALRDDIEWRAFCYLSDEMSIEERELFESELETDLAACEALARMVEVSLATSQQLNGVINSASQGEINSTCHFDRDVSSRSRRWMGLLLTTVALVLVGIQLLSPSATNSKTETLVASDQIDRAGELLTQWNSPLPSLPERNLEVGESLDDEFASLRIEETSDLEADDSGVPTWMIAALTLEDTSVSADDSSEMKDN